MASLFSPIRTRLGFMFPDKAKMVRNANALLLVLAVAPVLYLVIAALVTFGKEGLARDQNIVPVLFFAFVVVSLVNIGTMVFVQTSKSIMSERGRYDPVGRTYLVMSTGAILVEAHAVYGLVLTLLSSSIFYAIGFSLVAWACLWWVRDRFKMNLGKLPNAQSSQAIQAQTTNNNEDLQTRSTQPFPRNSDDYLPDDNDIRAMLMKTAKLSKILISELQRAGLAGQVQAEMIPFDLIVALFESLTSGSGGGSVVGEEGEACQRY